MAKKQEGEWQEVKLGDVVEIRRGASPRPIHLFLSDTGMPWVKIADATSDSSRYISKTNECIKEEGIAHSVMVEPETLIVSNSATPGLPKIMKIKACVHDGWLVFSNYKGINRDFLYYKFKDIQRFLINQANGSVFQNLKTDIVRDFSINLPPLDVQKKIAGVLGALDDKIELNNKINQNLEAQAQALFKSWFVDFEPFGGKMPDDWKIGRLGEIADITMGQSPNGSSYNEDKQGCIFFQGRAEFGKRFPSVRLYTTEPKRMAKKNDILMSVRAPVGDFNIAVEDCCIGRGLCSIRAKGNFQSFVLYTIWGLQKQLEIFNGEGTVFGAINKDSLNSLPITIPSLTDIAQFEHIVSSLDNIIRNNFLENTRLAELRDTLLPKLMSGEINVDDVKID